MNKKIVILGLLTFSALFADLFAEDVKVSNNEVKETDKNIEVTVTASRGKEQTALELPQIVDNLKREDVLDTATEDLDDALRILPNVSMAPAEGNPNFWQEGFSIRGLGAQRVLTLTDGVRQAGQGVGYGGGNVSLYDPLSIEKIEVVKGPGSVMYGTDSFGGVVNVITKEPKRRKEAGVNGGVRYMYDGSRDQNRVGTYVDFGDKDYGSVLGFSYTDSKEPNLPNNEDARGGEYENFSGYGKTDYYMNEDNKVRLIYNLSKTNDIGIEDTAFPLPLASFPPPGKEELVFVPLQFDIPLYQRSLLGAELESKAVGNFDLVKTGVYWQNIQRELERVTGFYNKGNPGFAGPPLFFDPEAEVRVSAVETDDEINTYEWNTQGRMSSGDHNLTMGLDLGMDTSYLPENEVQLTFGRAGVGQISPEFAGASSRVRADASQFRAGVYLQDEFEKGDFTFLPGVRGDLYSVKDDQTDFDDSAFGVSGSLGNVYKLSDEDSAFLNLGSGFRAPDLGERFQAGIVNFGVPTQIIGKADLDPERAYSAELGAKKETKEVRSSISAFGTTVHDYIGPRSLGVVNGLVTEQYENVGTVDLYGGEFSFAAKPWDGAELFANGGRTWTDDKDLVNVPNWMFNYGPAYTYAINSGFIKDLRAALVLRTVLHSKEEIPRPGQDQFDGDSFTVANLEFTLSTTKCELGYGKILAGIRNLFDKECEEPFFSRFQPERSFYAGVEFNF